MDLSASQTGSPFTFDLAVEIWKSLNYAPNSFDFKANQLYQILQGYTPQVQQVQTLPQRIHYAAFIVSNAMELEHDLLWGPYGYQAMLTRLVLNRPFRDADETVKYMVLPLRYSVAMELKQKATYLLNGVRLSYNSLRSELERLARGLGIPYGYNPPQGITPEQIRRIEVQRRHQELLERPRSPSPASIIEELAQNPERREADQRRHDQLCPYHSTPAAGEPMSMAEFENRIVYAFWHGDIRQEWLEHHEGQQNPHGPNDMLQHVIQNIVDRIRAVCRRSGQELNIHYLFATQDAATQTVAIPPRLSPPVLGASPSRSPSPPQESPRQEAAEEPSLLQRIQEVRQDLQRVQEEYEEFRRRRTLRRRLWMEGRSGLSRPQNPGGQAVRHSPRLFRSPLPYRPRRRSRSPDTGRNIDDML